LKKVLSFKLLLYLAMSMVILITLLPFIYVLINSLKGYTAYLEHKIFLTPADLTLSAYKSIFTTNNALTAIINSIKYTLVGTSLSVFLTILTAYPLSKSDFFGGKTIMFLIVFTLLFAVGIVPLYLLVNNLNMVNKFWSVIIPFLVNPWNLILTKTFFENIPESIEQAAYIDGCNDIKVLFNIIIPISMPIIATISLYYSVAYWNSYFWPMVFLNSKKLYPIQIILRDIVIQGAMAGEMASASDGDVLMSESIKFAVIIVATLPIVMVYPFLQKYFVKGILVGSIKG
jgi:putative aldouronate transport system permease protein